MITIDSGLAGDLEPEFASDAAAAEPAFPEPDPTSELPEQPDLADRLDHLCRLHGARYDRRREGDEIVLRLSFANGMRLPGRGPTTAVALEQLEARVKEILG